VVTTFPVEPAAEPDVVPDPSPRPRWRAAVRPGRAALFGAVAATAVLLGRGSGVLEGMPGLLGAAALILLVPTSREFSRRILLAGCLLLGWVPVLWWWPLPVGGLGRATIGLAVLAFGLATWVGAGRRPWSRALRLLPRLRVVDVLVPVTAGAGLLVLSPWLQTKSAVQTLGMLMSGWDNVAHFSMVTMIRRYGVTVDAMANPPSGGTWQYASYPEGFHAAVVAIIEVMRGPALGDLGSELLDYAQGVALLVVAVTVMVVAGIASLPVLRRRPGLAIPSAAFAGGVLLLGPGSHAIQGGFGNFLVAAALVVALALLAVTTTRVLDPLRLAALGGAVVGIATGWVLLLALAVPAVLVVLLPFRRSRWRASRAPVVVSALVVVAVVACLVRVAVVVSRVQVENPLTLTGGFVAPGVGLVTASVCGMVGACLLLGRVGRGPFSRATALRVTTLLGVPLVGVAVAVVLAAVQVQTNGAITYYGYKFMTGLLVVVLVLLAVPVGYALAGFSRPARLRERVRGALATLVMTVAATQVFGLTLPADPALSAVPATPAERAGPTGVTGGITALAPTLPPGLTNRNQQLKTLLQPPTTAYLAAQVELLDRRGGLGGPAYYVDVPSDGRVNYKLAAQWFLALTDEWTSNANRTAVSIHLDDAPTYADGAAAIREVLDADPENIVVVRLAYRRALLPILDDPFLATRIIGI
jgi:hypothetical protein